MTRNGDCRSKRPDRALLPADRGTIIASVGQTENGNVVRLSLPPELPALATGATWFMVHASYSSLHHDIPHRLRVPDVPAGSRPAPPGPPASPRSSRDPTQPEIFAPWIVAARIASSGVILPWRVSTAPSAPQPVELAVRAELTFPPRSMIAFGAARPPRSVVVGAPSTAANARRPPRRRERSAAVLPNVRLLVPVVSPLSPP